MSGPRQFGCQLSKVTFGPAKSLARDTCYRQKPLISMTPLSWTDRTPVLIRYCGRKNDRPVLPRKAFHSLKSLPGRVDPLEAAHFDS
jgi:hypothetical protein